MDGDAVPDVLVGSDDVALVGTVAFWLNAVVDGVCVGLLVVVFCPDTLVDDVGEEEIELYVEDSDGVTELEP